MIDAKGQTTLPKAVREALSVQPGDRVRYFIHQDGHVRITAVGPIGRLFGTLMHGGPAVTLQEMDHTIAEGVVCDRPTL